MKKLFIAVILTLSLLGCKKETIVSTGDTTIQVVSLPKLVKNVAAPDGVLSFENKKSLEVFLKDLEYNKAPSGDKLPIGFKSLHDFFQAYRDKVALKSTHSNNVQNNYQTLTENDLSSESTVEEYVYNLDSYLVPDERFSYVLNEDLQVMVDGNFYQITRLGTLLINSQYVEQFAEWYPTVENDVMYNPSVTSFQNEISLGNNEFQVAEGITRLAFDEVQSNGGDFFVEPLDASGSLTGSPTSTTSEKMDTYEVSTKFNRSENIRKGDRRFVFQAYNDNFLRLNIFQSVGVKGKVQRQRKFGSLNIGANRLVMR